MPKEHDPKLQWIRDRLDLANWAAYARTQEQSSLTTVCPICKAIMLNDGTFETCGDCQ